jgi:hypothetical protein
VAANDFQLSVEIIYKTAKNLTGTEEIDKNMESSNFEIVE